MKSRLLLTMLVLLGINLSVLKAAETKAGENINITERVEQDLYLAGDEVRIQAVVDGDIVIAAGNIQVEDTVTGDALLAGGNLTIDGYVGDDIRAFTGNLYINGDVGGDLLVFGGKIKVRENSVIHGDVIIFGGQLELEGKILGDVMSFGGTTTFTGTIAGNAQLKGGDFLIDGEITGTTLLVAQTIELGSKAKFNEEVRYWRELGEMDFGSAASKAVYDPSLSDHLKDNNWGPGVFGFFFYLFFAAMALSLVWIFGFGNRFSQASGRWKADFFKSMGFGILYIAATPILIVLLMVSFVGLPIALLSLCLYIFSLIFAPSILGVVVTYWLRDRYSRNWTRWMMVLISAAIVLALWMVFMIPLVGWLIGLVLVSAGFGALILGRAPEVIQVGE